ncbi:MAG: MarR family transcriptional regulator [Nanoarchaeota archaeon]
METLRFFGIANMTIATILLIIGFNYINSAEKALLAGHDTGPEGECVHQQGLTCPYQELNRLALPKFIGLGVITFLFIVGLLLYLKKQPQEKIREKAAVTTKSLDGEEALIFDILRQSEGMIFQSDLVTKTALSKVKITRILDKLEGKNLIERRRRGMTNAVILK